MANASPSPAPAPTPRPAAAPRAFVCMKCGAMGKAVPGSPCPKCGVPLPGGAQKSSSQNIPPRGATPSGGNRAVDNTVISETEPPSRGEAALADMSLEAAAASNDPKRRVGKYVLVSELGRGGMGVVFKAFDTALKRTVALKMILDPTRAGPEALRRFQTEASAAAKLEHPAIVKVYEVGEHDSKPYLVLELIDGGSLEEALERSPMPMKRCAEIVRDVALALDCAHENGVIHRDVKPENVLLDKKGKPHLMDFGLARDKEERDRLTKTGSLLGTPAYMAPEQASGEARKQGAHSDIYAIGALLYRTIAGRPPFVGESNMEVMQKVMEEEPDPPRKVNPKVPKELEAIALRCLEKDSADRYPTAADVAEELRRFLEGEKVETQRKSTAGRALKRHTKAIVAAFFVLLGVAGSVAWAFNAMKEAELAQKKDQEEKDRLAREAEEQKKRDEAARALEERRKEADGLVASARAGKLEALSDYDAALAKICTDADAHTVATLARAIDEVRAQLDAAWKDEVLKAKDPLPDETGAQPIDGLDRAVERRCLLSPGEELDPSSAAVLRQALKRLEGRAGAAKKDGLALVAAAQERKLGAGGVRLEKLACEALGRLKIQEGAVSPLSKLLFSDEDPDRAFDAASALARIGAKDAEKLVILRRAQLGPSRSFWKKAAELYPKSLPRETPETLLENGKAKHQEGDLQGAIAEFSRAIELKPDFAPAWARRSMARIEAGDKEGGVEDGNKATELAPDGALALCARGISRISKRDREGGLADLGRALELAPDDAFIWARRAIVRRDLRDYEGSIADFTKALDLAPKSAETWAGRSFAKRDKGDYDGGIDDATRGIEVDERCGSAWAARGAGRTAKGDLAGALADLTRATELEPNKASHWNRRGQAKLGSKDWKGAIEDFTRAISIDGHYAIAYNNRGAARQRLGDRGALADFEEAVKSDPYFYQLWVNLETAWESTGDVEGTLKTMSRLVDAHPEVAEAWAQRGIARISANDLDGALQDLDKAISIDPTCVDAACNRGVVRQMKGDVKGSLADFQKTTELNPKWVNGWFNLGGVKMLMGDLDGALKDLDRALEIDPSSFHALANRGVVKVRKKDFRGGLADLDKAIALDGTLALCWDAHAEARCGLGETDAALADVKKAIDLAPDFNRSYLTRGLILKKKGDKKAATADIEKFISMSAKDDIDLPAARKALDELKKK